jgi:hypothetical protein
VGEQRQCGRGLEIKRYFGPLALIFLCAAGLYGLAYYMGRPLPVQNFEVDVTDRVAAWGSSDAIEPVTLDDAGVRKWSDDSARPSDEVK